MPDNTDEHSPTPVPLELDDLVRVKSSGALAFIERLSGDSSDEETDDDSDDGSITDSRGRLIRWHDNPSRRHEQTEDTHAYPQQQSRPLISQYDDSDDDVADNHESEQKFPDTPVRDAAANRNQQHQTNGAASTNSTQRVVVPEGSALVTMASTGNEVLLEENQLQLLDRSLDPGCLVTPADPLTTDFPSAQTGLVESVSKNLYVRRIADITPATVTVPDPATCFKVPADRLGFFSGIRANDTVVRGVWVGAVDYFQEDIYVEFSDGAIACVPGHRKALQNIDIRTPDPKKVDPFSEGQYYPGQRVKSSAHVWKNIAMWIRGSYSDNNEGVVKSVKVGDVGVGWVAKSMYANTGPALSDDQDMNSEVVRFSDITPLEAFRSLWWTVGDRGFLLDETSQSVQSGQSHEWEEPTAETDDSDDEDGEWEEEMEDAMPSSMSRRTPSEAQAKSSSKGRSRKQGGRLMKAQRRARERNGANDQKGTVTDVSLAHSSADTNEVIQVVGTETSVVVLWQDGTRSVNLPALQLRVKDQPEPYDFWPGDLVVRHDDFGDESEEDQKIKQRGVIVSLNPSERTALVKWQNEDGSKFEMEEEMSIYELRPEATNMAIGDTVLRIPKDSSQQHVDGNTPEGQTEWVGTVTGLNMGECRVAWHGGKVGTVPFSELLYIDADDEGSFESNSSPSDIDATEGLQLLTQDGDWPVPEELISALQPNWGLDDDEEARGNDQDAEMGNSVDVARRSMNDHAFHIPKTTIEDGKKVLSEEIEVMSQSGRRHLTLKSIDSSEVVRKATKSTIDLIDALHGQKPARKLSTDMCQEVVQSVAGVLAANAFSEVWTASLRIQSDQSSCTIASTCPLFWTQLSEILQSIYEAIARNIEQWVSSKLAGGSQTISEIASGNEILKKTINGDIAVGSTEKSHVPESTSDAVNKLNALDNNDETIPLERFSVCEDLEGFHSFSSQPSSSSHPVGFAGIVRKEWARLKKHLPPGMWVRVCENRNDRLRAAIVGPRDTPYADVLFFFDIWMGTKYPMEAPSVWFHSHGRRLNPNLYEDGKVCLSILGTWDGDDVESWDPATSNLLRVLLSLQALVFVDEPYYNEAGYMKQRGSEEGHVNSRMYNESAYLLSMKHVLTTLKSGGTPKDCVEIAVSHYKEHGKRILDRCKTLIENNGEHAIDDNSDANNRDKRRPYSSVGFRRSLAKVLEPLGKAISALP